MLVIDRVSPGATLRRPLRGLITRLPESATHPVPPRRINVLDSRPPPSYPACTSRRPPRRPPCSRKGSLSHDPSPAKPRPRARGRRPAGTPRGRTRQQGRHPPAAGPHRLPDQRVDRRLRRPRRRPGAQGRRVAPDAGRRRRQQAVIHLPRQGGRQAGDRAPAPQRPPAAARQVHARRGR